MLLEMHSHTNRHSDCSLINPVTLIRKAEKKGLQGLIITEHQYLWDKEELLKLRAESEVSANFLILAAQEVNTEIGHVLVYGAGRSITDDITLKELKSLYPRAALVWAHPFRHGKKPTKEQLLNPLIDGIEIFSANQLPNENYLGLKMWHAHKFTAISGSDTHEEAKTAIYPTQFDHPVNSIEEVANEIKHSRCRPFFKEIPKAGTNMQVTEIIFGTKGTDELRNRIIMKKISDEKKWKKENDTAKITKALYEKGFNDASQFRVPKIIDIDEKERMFMEEGQRGRNLFELLLNVNKKTGLEYFTLTAKWLAKLHNMKLRISGTEDTVKKEERRFKSYRKSFISTNNPYTKDAVKLIDFVEQKQQELLSANSGLLLQNHGDFHPKNVIIGHEKAHDPSTLYISVIDFDSSLVFPPAFDIGYFLAQFKSQFGGYADILTHYNEEIFIKAYRKESKLGLDNMENLINFFKIRANLNIASYLIKVGKGESGEIKSIITESKNLMPKTGNKKIF
ncbi:MAG: phosphotransferase [Endomicrobiales bacterium]|nr:phosphotransferase [Endomicrobiales bacterium]